MTDTYRGSDITQRTPIMVYEKGKEEYKKLKNDFNEVYMPLPEPCYLMRITMGFNRIANSEIFTLCTPYFY